MDIILERRTTFIFAGIITSIAFLFCAAIDPLISFVAACGLFIFLLSLYFKEKVFFAFIFLYPLIPSYFAFDLGGSLPLLTVSRLLFIYVVLFDFIFNRDKFRKIKEMNLDKEIKILSFSVAFLVLNYMLNYFTYPNGESIKILSSFFLEGVLLGVYVFFRAGNRGDVEKAVKCFLFAAFFIGLTGIVEFLLKVNLFSYLDIVKSSRQLFTSDVYSRLGESRIEGPFGHPLAYCNYLLMAIPMGIYEWQISKEIKVKTGYFGLTLVLLVNFLLTLSRGPMLALIAGLLVFFAFTDTRSKQILFMLGTALAGLLLVGMAARAVPWFIRNFFQSLLDSVFMKNTANGFGDDSNASEYRLYLFNLAKKLVTDKYIWFGRGISFFRLNAVYDWVPGRSTIHETRITSVDNFYILKYIEMGLTGVISTLMLIFSLIYSCIAGLAKSLKKEFNLCFLFIYVSYFISLFTVDEIGTLRFLLIITGILMANLSLRQEEE